MILISSCLVGHPVRYDGRSKTNVIFAELVDKKKAIHACPEMLGGLTVPRAPAEIVGGDGDDCLDGRARVITTDGTDVTAEFIAGAKQTLQYCKDYNVSAVVLKANSPSCGSDQIYDGSFSGKLKAGNGVTAALLRRHDIHVMSEDEFVNNLDDASLIE
ncbi:DUF523 domain-containing protein [Macrococcoides canis]|uniref:DUF523 domain-containing protein n=1 Tax=Macrococcoides canis TaxID=1855823 RepID=UPI00105BBD72|nr:DUF523 domain-containing protein [Macrococcus canis]TDM20626.1 DUF523 domain-containing protein [Macrococcus canis]TDM22319.1 DUF523 domain-containing protein [Macrococcus canis]TDM33104.1 DUF523 domain-containing protein [Macrococcus canis]TDM36445.1 DUF523 domain-containing protein [Macrococcus canis]TDM43948.1 DUF523 domain-containing protein [Macrococcus canis]